jgi:hypothetical protein
LRDNDVLLHEVLLRKFFEVNGSVRHAAQNVLCKPPIGDAGIPPEQRDRPRRAKTSNVLERVADQLAKQWSWWKGALLNL